MAADPAPPTKPHVGKYEILLPKYRYPGEPESYRLSKSRIESQASCGAKGGAPRSRVSFRFRTRYISALASNNSNDHPHLFMLNLCPSLVAQAVHRFCRVLPASAQSWLRHVFPEWFLPDEIILKQQKEHSEDEDDVVVRELFDTEVKAYDRLKTLQGVIIPICYGRIRYRGRRALLLSHVGGVSLGSPEGATLQVEELSALLQPCYRALHAFGVHHDDPQPANFQLVHGRVMALDLERVAFDLSPDENEHFLSTNIGDLADRYRSIQRHYWFEGLLEPA